MGLGNQLLVLSIIVLGLSLYSIYRSARSAEGEVVAYRLPSPPAFDGALAVNDALADAEYVLKARIHGPESIVAVDDTLYTGTHDGRLVKIVAGEVVKEVRLVRTDTQCGDYDAELACGRPLGLRRLRAEQFVVADAYHGVFLVDFQSVHELPGKKQRLIDSRTPIDDKFSRFFNDIDVLSENEIIVSDSSAVFARKDFMREILGSKGTGRVFHHRISTGETTVLMRDLHFANGVQVLPDRESFVVSECTRARIMRYYLAGPKKGTSEVFIENLPGLPDNIRLSTNGTLWVGLASVRKEGQFNALEALSEYPRVRELMLAVLPDFVLRDLFPQFVPKYSMVIQLDVDGKIISSLHDRNGEKLREVSQITDGGDYLYFGSFKAPYIAKLKKF